MAVIAIFHELHARKLVQKEPTTQGFEKLYRHKLKAKEFKSYNVYA